MGACASKPKDLDSQEAPAPVEAPATPKAEAETAPQESNGGETKKEEPLVDLSEPEAPKEVATETKTAEGKEEAKSSESSEETAKPSEEKAETVEAAKEPAKEEKKEVADAAAETPKADAPVVKA